MKHTLQLEKNALINEFNDNLDRVLEIQNRVVNFLYKNKGTYIDSGSFKRLCETNKELTQAISEARGLLLKVKRKKQFSKIYAALDNIEILKGFLSLYFEQVKNSVTQYYKQQRFEEYHKANEEFVFTVARLGFFDDCKSKRDLIKKYKKLVKKYHPDNGGNPEDFVKITQQFEKRKEELS